MSLGEAVVLSVEVIVPIVPDVEGDVEAEEGESLGAVVVVLPLSGLSDSGVVAVVESDGVVADVVVVSVVVNVVIDTSSLLVVIEVEEADEVVEVMSGVLFSEQPHKSAVIKSNTMIFFIFVLLKVDGFCLYNIRQQNFGFVTDFF